MSVVTGLVRRIFATIYGYPKLFPLVSDCATWLGGLSLAAAFSRAGMTRSTMTGSAFAQLVILGLLAGPLAYHFVAGVPYPAASNLPWWQAVAGGLLVGIGVRLGSGCTSGHGVCGLGRLSPRSLAATLTFMATGILTVYLIRHVLVEYLP